MRATPSCAAATAPRSMPGSRSVMADVVEDGFRVPRPLPARDWRCDDGWTVDGWAAWTLVPGEHRETGADWPLGVEVARRFTTALAKVPRPPFTDTRTDLFADADRIAWGELVVPGPATRPS